jgi:hypothetical protein
MAIARVPAQTFSGLGRALRFSDASRQQIPRDRDLDFVTMTPRTSMLPTASIESQFASPTVP